MQFEDLSSIPEAYSYNDLLQAYGQAGVESGRIVYLTGNFGRLGKYFVEGKRSLLQAHLSALQELLGPQGTLVVPTHCWSLIRTDIPFDSLATPSEMGPFTEFVRQQPSSVRQFHPFSSHTAVGRQADVICSNNSRHVFGQCSPFQRMVERDALYVSVGMPIENTISLVHHVELMMGVPYRYTKEFVHPCLKDGKVSHELFYVFVTHHDCDIKRDSNEKILKHFRREGHSVRKVSLGRSFVESLSMLDFFNCTSELLRRDIYSWLSTPPTLRPYRI